MFDAGGWSAGIGGRFRVGTLRFAHPTGLCSGETSVRFSGMPSKRDSSSTMLSSSVLTNSSLNSGADNFVPRRSIAVLQLAPPPGGVGFATSTCSFSNW